jgi:hypothetical protein
MRFGSSVPDGKARMNPVKRRPHPWHHELNLLTIGDELSHEKKVA